MIDGEGHVRVHVPQGVREVGIHNSDPDLIDACTDALDMLGIEYAVYQSGNAGEHKRTKDMWVVIVRRKSELTKLNAAVNLRCKRKADNLQLAVDSFVGHSFKQNQHGLTPELLHQHYWDQEMAPVEIAEQYGVHVQLVYHIMHRHDIPRRSRSDSAKLARAKR